MEINFETRQAEVYREVYHQTRRIQESTESVVPDTEEDINRIAAVQTSVYLKSKDLTGRGVLISGEACASLVCIGEKQDSVSVVRTVKPFSVEYEIPDPTAEAQPQVALSIQAADARVVNPRKVSVTFEIASELSCYAKDAVSVDTLLPAEQDVSLYAKLDETELSLPNAVTEKIFAIHEQFPIPDGKPKPEKIATERAELTVTDCQLIGSKAVVKGNAELTVSYLSDEVDYPVRVDFSAPFSQIVDIGTEQMAFSTVRPELTAAYYDLTDTIGGEKALDVELHALLELVSYGREAVQYIADVYSNSMPCTPQRQAEVFAAVESSQRRKVTQEERVHVMDDCADVLSVFLTLTRPALEQGKLSAAVNLDIVYRTDSGQLSSARRTLVLSDENGGADQRLLTARLTDLSIRPDGQFIDVHLALELDLITADEVEVNRLTGAVLDEEQRFDPADYPAITLVRVQDESLWELAKQYHSSEDRIRESNPEDDGYRGRMLLIPRTI